MASPRGDIPPDFDLSHNPIDFDLRATPNAADSPAQGQFSRDTPNPAPSIPVPPYPNAGIQCVDVDPPITTVLTPDIQGWSSG
jgi:hypothetical protein